MMVGAAVALFTRDLRVHDNPMLVAAADSGRLIPVFVLDDAILNSRFASPNRMSFLRDCLIDLDAALRELGSAGLVVRRGDPVAQVCQLAAQVRAASVHVSADVSGYAARRTARLAAALGDRPLHVHPEVVTAVAPGRLTPPGKSHFAVFSAYQRRWAGVERRTPLPPPAGLGAARIARGRIPPLPALCPGPVSPDLPHGGEQLARVRLAHWLSHGLDRYATGHDDLAGDLTSRLSPHLHFGTLSPVELVHRVGTASEGARAFVRQLVWRDFHHQVLAARPDAADHDYRRARHWRRDDAMFAAWTAGHTGVPIVDAGMRQLAREGWMHNRARLITAGFLTRILGIDWRLGAQHFVDLLVDADMANNTMNWQWVAGTGNDTRPNRVLNPLRQADRYDPDGHYVRRYVPELAEIDGRAVHRPWRLDEPIRRRLDYPPPIVSPR